MGNRYCIIREDGKTKDVIFQDLSFNAGQHILLQLYNVANRTKYKDWCEVVNIPIVTSFSTDFADFTLKEVISPNI